MADLLDFSVAGLRGTESSDGSLFVWAPASMVELQLADVIKLRAALDLFVTRATEAGRDALQTSAKRGA